MQPFDSGRLLTACNQTDHESNALSDERERGVEGHVSYAVYILRFADNSLYIGQTGNLQARLESHRHDASKAAKFTKDHGHFELAYHEEHASRVGAVRRERQLKGWTRAKKEALIAGNKDVFRRL